MESPDRPPSRILVVDDNPEIHSDFRKLLVGDRATPDRESIESDRALAELIGSGSDESSGSVTKTFEIDTATQGQEALAKVEAAIAQGRPYALAFVDMRMPPGWDGLETIDRLVQADARLQVVICTAYSDHDWGDIHRRIGNVDNVLVLKKPFDGIEARQMTWALCEKWELAREAESRQSELEARNDELQREIVRREAAEQRLMHDALHDVLTSLPNRALVSDRIERGLATCKRDPNHKMALAFIDLDDFKVVNDSLGHDAGDRMLVELSTRIVNCTRQTDCASRNVGNTVARLGGDEFLVLLDGLRHADDAVFIARRILESLSEPLTLDGHDLKPQASLGLAYGGADYEDATALIRDADTALYRAKAEGKAAVVVFDSELRREALARMRIESELRQAIASDQLFLQYQPIVSLDDLGTVGFESLVRWRHPTQGIIPPGEFVPLAEETGLILPLGAWVLRHACEQVADWRRRIPAAAKIFVNVNFSTKQLTSPNFVDDLLRVLAENGLERHELHVEMTESLLVQQAGPAARAVQRMSEESILMHIDDFGTGFSSLSYLHRLPVSAIKLDRSFLRSFDGGSTNVATIKAVIEMAHARNLRVVAEGIETAGQLAMLQELGCDLGQGFYFARPLDADQVEHRLTTNAGTIAA